MVLRAVHQLATGHRLQAVFGPHPRQNAHTKRPIFSNLPQARRALPEAPQMQTLATVSTQGGEGVYPKRRALFYSLPPGARSLLFQTLAETIACSGQLYRPLDHAHCGSRSAYSGFGLRQDLEQFQEPAT
jgi:hypothetical protein